LSLAQPLTYLHFEISMLEREADFFGMANTEGPSSLNHIQALRLNKAAPKVIINGLGLTTTTCSKRRFS
jgi:hypothetical protein